MEDKIPYYEDNTRISNSAIGWYLKNGPSYLHKKLTGLIPDEKGISLERGTMIHEYVLQPEEFNKDYVVANDNIKRPISDNQKRFCKKLVDTVEIEPNKAVLSAYRASYSIIGKSEDKMLSEGLEMASTLKDYIALIRDGRKIITTKDIAKCDSVLENINGHKIAKILLDETGWEKHCEFHINWERNQVKCKSLLDCVKFNFEEKRCQIIDLKTTTKLWHFKDSMEQYDYMRQLCFYYHAVLYYLTNERSIEPNEIFNDWKFEFYIVAIDSTFDSDVRVFKFSSTQVNSRLQTIDDTLLKIRWHYSTNCWNRTKEYFDGDGCETIDL